MPATITGDYSKYPPSIRCIFPLVAGEACELRQAWGIYSRLFMEKKELTEAMGERLGGVWGMLQALLQEEMLLSIARLTDQDTRQKNLSLWSLLVALPDARDACFGDKVRMALDQICAAAAGVRKHRHKRIAHFDLSVSLSTAILPIVTFNEIRGMLEQIEAFLNLFYWEFEETTMFFETLQAYDITGKAEVTAYKARAYDLLEAEGVIPQLEWRRRAEK